MCVVVSEGFLVAGANVLVGIRAKKLMFRMCVRAGSMCLGVVGDWWEGIFIGSEEFERAHMLTDRLVIAGRRGRVEGNPSRHCKMIPHITSTWYCLAKHLTTLHLHGRLLKLCISSIEVTPQAQASVSSHAFSCTLLTLLAFERRWRLFAW